MISPLTARYLREILQAALGDQLTIPIPAPTAVMAVEQLQKNLAQLGALAAIALAMGSVAGELDRGTAALVLAQPVTRAAFISAKLAALAIVLGISVGLAAVSAWVYTGVLFEPLPVGGWLAMAALSWLALCAWAALTFLASAATGSTTLAAGLGFVALVVISLGAIVPALDRLLPTGLTTPAIVLASGETGLNAGALVTAIAGTAVLIAACLGGAILAFRRRELSGIRNGARSGAVRGWRCWLARERAGRSGAGLALEALLEALDLAGGVDDVLLAREERVAVAAHVDAQLFAGGADFELGPARAAVDLGLEVLGVGVALHECSFDAVRTGLARRWSPLWFRAATPWRRSARPQPG